jgi:hypothetical protein
MVAAGHSVTVDPARWQELFDQVMGRVAGRPAVTGDAHVVEAVALHHGVCIRPAPGRLDPDADLPCQQRSEEAPTLITDTLDSPAPFRDDRWRVKVGQFAADDKVPS